MNNVFKFTKEIIEEASKIVLKNTKKLNRIYYKKGESNLVTSVDRKVEKLIIKKISLKYPNHSIVAEESGKYNRDPKYKWFIDPIDGTTNFVHGYPCFCISIAFTKDDIVEFGLVKNPLTNELYSAIRNHGAKLNGKTILVSKIKKLRESLLITGFPYDKKTSRRNNFNNFQNLTKFSHGVRRDGAAALDLCYIAQGVADGFWEIKLSPWDVAAGFLIVGEAGGKITGFKGKQFNLYSKEIVASNGFIHNELIKHLR